MTWAMQQEVQITTAKQGRDEMAQSPKWKVFDGSGMYQAACKEIEAAAACKNSRKGQTND